MIGWAIALALGAVALATLAGDDPRWRKRKPLGPRWRKRKPIDIAPTWRPGRLQGLAIFDHGTALGTLQPPSEPPGGPDMVSFPLGVPPDRPAVSYVVDVQIDGDKSKARGRFRANLETVGGDWQIRMGPTVPEDMIDHPMKAWRFMGYIVDRRRGTVGFGGFSMQGGVLLFNVMSLAGGTFIYRGATGDAAVKITWWGT